MAEYRLVLNDNEYEKCVDFAKKSCATQREHRSGGRQCRSLWMIEKDTLRGKVAEVLSKKFLEQNPLNVSDISLDFDVYPRGEWDSNDFEIFGKKISVKSAKWFSKWLLLESKDISRGDVYDYYLFVTVNKDYKSGTMHGFATKEDILSPNPNTLKLNRGDFIPNTTTRLDASNYARHIKDLRNSIEEWKKLCSKI